MSDSNIFNISKGDLTRCNLLWSRTTNRPSPINTTTLEFDHGGYGLLIIVYSGHIYTQSSTGSNGSITTWYVDGVYDTCVIVNDPSIPYTQFINSTEVSIGYRPITIQNNGLFIGAHSKNANNCIIPYRIYGIR